jgi:hypothetical protein
VRVQRPIFHAELPIRQRCRHRAAPFPLAAGDRQRCPERVFARYTRAAHDAKLSALDLLQNEPN